MISFRYQPLTMLGQPTGWFSNHGSFDGQVLRLDEAEFPVDTIVMTGLRDKTLVFQAIHEGGTYDGLLLIYSGNEKALKHAIDVRRSRGMVARAQEAWKAGGEHAPFRKEQCPVCQAMLDLSRFQATPQIFCDYCETLSTVPRQPETPSNEHEYRLCDYCGMYSRPVRFTEFYFYFVFVAFGIWTNQSQRCPGCMRWAAWKMLWINFLFVLGIIPSIWQWIRACLSDRIAGPFLGLHAANLNAVRGRYAQAIHTYQSILEVVPFAAGVHYNLGLAMIKHREWERAKLAFEMSLEDCSNYRFAAAKLCQCYEQLGDSAAIAPLAAQWDSNLNP